MLLKSAHTRGGAVQTKANDTLDLRVARLLAAKGPRF